MTTKLETLASEIAALGEQEQRQLLQRISELNFRRGLSALSDQYRERLRQVGRLDQSADQVLAELRRIREEMAAGDSPR
jgi:hypothetical protein